MTPDGSLKSQGQNGQGKNFILYKIIQPHHTFTFLRDKAENKMTKDSTNKHKVVLSVAPTGARRTKKDHPNIPLTSKEISIEAARCADAGASLIHLHVRDSRGMHTLDPGIYQDAILAIRHSVQHRLIIQVTTESLGEYSPQEQMAMVRKLKPEAVSLCLREFLQDNTNEHEIADFFSWLERERIGRQYILFSPNEVRLFINLHQRGIIPGDRQNVLFVLGRYATNQYSDPMHIHPFLEHFPPEWNWSLCAFGAMETRCMATTVALGGHVRVGFENNIYLADGTIAPSNSVIVANISRLLIRDKV
jgi:3-keto-5-aminohexanoate cleavage enzyme